MEEKKLNPYETMLIKKALDHYFRFLESFGQVYNIEYWEEESKDIMQVIEKLRYAEEMKITKIDKESKELDELMESEELPF